MSEILTDRIVRYPEAAKIVGLAVSSIRRLESEGKFPKRFQIGPRAVGYRLSDINRYLEDREQVSGGKVLL